MQISYFSFQGLMARVYETFIVLCLLAVVVLGMTYVLSAFIDKEQSNIYRLLSKLANAFIAAMALLCF
jgi:Na+-transporting methylmalonyl-CoA/oxaloacetate decarboxylase gamma subunit